MCRSDELVIPSSIETPGEPGTYAPEDTRKNIYRGTIYYSKNWEMTQTTIDRKIHK